MRKERKRKTKRARQREKRQQQRKKKKTKNKKKNNNKRRRHKRRGGSSLISRVTITKSETAGSSKKFTALGTARNQLNGKQGAPFIVTICRLPSGEGDEQNNRTLLISLLLLVPSRCSPSPSLPPVLPPFLFTFFCLLSL